MLGLARSLLLLHVASQWVCSHTQLCSAQPFSDLSAPVQAWRPPFPWPSQQRHQVLQTSFAHSGIQILVCTHITALISPVPPCESSFLPAQELCTCLSLAISRASWSSCELNHILPMRSEPQPWGWDPSLSLSFLSAFSLHLFSYSLIIA